MYYSSSNEHVIDNIFVDYAHNENSLQQSLLTLKEISNNNQKLWEVFGCGGNRDVSKRKKMGTIAKELADIQVITDDNPRNEDPTAIRKQIISGCTNAIEIGDRKEAIQYAITNASNQDIILIAGKGHEKYQIIKDDKFFFSDKKTVLSCKNNNVSATV
jgi:UDP-N-acetylmuramoyl-L-alanyl-D-glutamate--2,6-diaminopimelate ligase